MRILVLLAAALTLRAQPVYDLLLKGGHVVDAKNHISRVMDVAVAAGKIAKVAPNIPASQSRKAIDLKGLYVTPGLIDIHAHLYNRPGNPPRDETRVFSPTLSRSAAASPLSSTQAHRAGAIFPTSKKSRLTGRKREFWPG